MAGKVVKLWDGLVNVGLNLGSGRAKSPNTRYQPSPLNDDEITAAYRYAWLPRKVVDLPAQDSTREWRVWDNKKIGPLEEKLELKNSLMRAFTSARLYGHAGIYIGTDSRNVGTPMAENEQIRSLTVVDHDYISVSEWDDDPASPDFGKPKAFHIGDRDVHPSRVVLLIGSAVPGDRNCLGDSVLQSCYEALKNADSVAANVAELVFEAKIDVVKVPGLMQNVGDTEYVDALNKRIALMMQFKSINNALLMDAEEEWDQKQIVFGSLNELLMTAYQITAGAASIPMTRLLGRSASGLNSSGNNEIRDYYDTIRGIQTMQLEPALLRLDQQLCNMVDDQSADYEWKSLWQPDDIDRAMANQYDAYAFGTLAKSGLFDDASLVKYANEILDAPMLKQTKEPKTNPVPAQLQAFTGQPPADPNAVEPPPPVLTKKPDVTPPKK